MKLYRLSQVNTIKCVAIVLATRCESARAITSLKMAETKFKTHKLTCTCTHHSKTIYKISNQSEERRKRSCRDRISEVMNQRKAITPSKMAETKQNKTKKKKKKKKKCISSCHKEAIYNNLNQSDERCKRSCGDRFWTDGWKDRWTDAHPDGRVSFL